MGYGSGMRGGLGLCLISTLNHALIFGSFVLWLQMCFFLSFSFWWVWKKVIQNEMAVKKPNYSFYGPSIIYKHINILFCNSRSRGSYKTKANLVIDIQMDIWQFTELLWLDTEHLVIFDTSAIWKVLTADVQFNCITWDFCVPECEFLSNWLRKIWGEPSIKTGGNNIQKSILILVVVNKTALHYVTGRTKLIYLYLLPRVVKHVHAISENIW